MLAITFDSKLRLEKFLVHWKAGIVFHNSLEDVGGRKLNRYKVKNPILTNYLPFLAPFRLEPCGLNAEVRRACLISYTYMYETLPRRHSCPVACSRDLFPFPPPTVPPSPPFLSLS